MKAMRMINAVDSHTMGEPTRIITGGVPVIPGKTMAEKKEQKGKRNKKGQTMGLITDRHSARSNPGAFQEKVLAMYEQKILELKSSL